jgi:competence protein ComEC
MRTTVALLLSFSFALFVSFPAAQTRTAKTLDIYYIDTEGGQETLFVSPSGETVLVDTGSPGGRDTERTMEAITAAGVKQIDYLVMTHYHGDHVGGFPEIAARIPILHFIDHGPTIQPEQNSASKQAYDAAIAKGPHVVAKPGDKIPVAGLDWQIVTSAGKALTTTLAGAPGAGKPNPYCAGVKPKDIQTDLENGQSVGSVITYGKFRTIDLGDLLWNVELDLMCPVNRIGTVDLLLVSHHGVDWSSSPALVHALQPRVAVMVNGTRKGGNVEVFKTLESSPGLENLWQLHWSYNGVIEHNVAGAFIANIDDAQTLAGIVTNPPPPATGILGPPPARAAAPGGAGQAGRGGPGGPARAGGPGGPGAGAHTPAYLIKVSAQADGTFTVTNTRNGFSKTYKPRN